MPHTESIRTRRPIRRRITDPVAGGPDVPAPMIIPAYPSVPGKKRPGGGGMVFPRGGRGGRQGRSRPIRTLAVSLLACCTTLPGCSGTRTSDRDLVWVSNEDALRGVERRARGLRLAESRGGAFVDPRSRDEFIARRIPGAIHLPLERARADHETLRRFDTIVVYGPDASSPLAAAMSKVLIELGYSDVRTLRAGLAGWVAEGRKTESGHPPRGS